MKRKIWFSFLLIALSAAMIGGATMAWFTAQADAPTATFTAGTVVVGADQGEKFIGTPEGKYFENVNPGDCATVYWDIINEGTKAVELKVKLDKAWENDLPTSNVYYAPRPDSGWVMYEEDGEIWLAYTGGPVPGTYGNTDVADARYLFPSWLDLTENKPITSIRAKGLPLMLKFMQSKLPTAHRQRCLAMHG